MAIDDQLAVLLAQNAELFATYEEWANGQIMLLAGTVDDPNSFNEAGGKTGALGYYPVVNVSGQTIYVPCLARLRALALGGENAEGFEELVAQVAGKLVAVDTAITATNASAANAGVLAATAKASGDYARDQANAIGDISTARDQTVAAAQQAVSTVALIGTPFPTIDNWRELLVDIDGRPLGGIKHDETKWEIRAGALAQVLATPVVAGRPTYTDLTVTGMLDAPGLSAEYPTIGEWDDLTLDVTGRISKGIKKDGTAWLAQGGVLVQVTLSQFFATNVAASSGAFQSLTVSGSLVAP